MATQPKDRVEVFFNALKSDTMDLVDQFYEEGIRFEDPIVNFDDRATLKRYYAGLYQGVNNIRFDFKTQMWDGDVYMGSWTMHLKSKTLTPDEWIIVDGVSEIHFAPNGGGAIYHRDTFDVGAMVYEKIPVLRTIIGWIKNKLH